MYIELFLPRRNMIKLIEFNMKYDYVIRAVKPYKHTDVTGKVHIDIGELYADLKLLMSYHILGSGNQTDLDRFATLVQLWLQSLTRKSLVFFQTQIHNLYLYFKNYLPTKLWMTAVIHKNIFRSNKKKICIRIKYRYWQADAYMGSYLPSKNLKATYFYRHLDDPRTPRHNRTRRKSSRKSCRILFDQNI